MNPIGHLWKCRAVFLVPLAILAPLKLLLIEEDTAEEEQKWKCAYIIVLMAILWLTEAIPISATALIPIFLAPMLGVSTAKEVTGSYVGDTSMLFLGGLIVAVAVEDWNLHKRIALFVMRVLGVHPVMLMLGLMLPTWFLSMWISNTAATAMMLPIIQAVIQTFWKVRQGAYTSGMSGTENTGYVLTEEISNGSPPQETSDHSINITSKDQEKRPTQNEPLPQTVEVKAGDGDNEVVVTPNDPTLPADFVRMAKGFSLCVAYGANIGGIATLTGTPPNLVMKGVVDELYEDLGQESPITFADWMGFAFPLSLITLILSWLWLCLFFLRTGTCKRQNKSTKAAVSATVRGQWRALGRITLAETEVIILFVLLVVFWLFRKPPNIDGWGQLFIVEGTYYVSDSTPAMLIVLVMFVIPAKVPQLFFCGYEKAQYTPLLNWKSVEKKVPWGVIILLGGGFAIASMTGKSGLAAWLGLQLKRFEFLEPRVMNLIICIIAAAATEVTSNTATTTLLLPIMAQLAISTGTHPLLLMISTTVACSFAFMLPVATPPNAMVFSTRWLRIVDMFIVGLPMNIIAIAALTLAINTWGKNMYSLHTIPEFFENANVTLS